MLAALAQTATPKSKWPGAPVLQPPLAMKQIIAVEKAYL